MSATQTIATTGRLYRDFYVIGDVHGAIDGLRRILEHAGLIKADQRWCGGRSHVVQCGDIVDRGSASRECLELLLSLRKQARQAGGRVDLLVGNHELALARGDYTISDLTNPAEMGAVLADAIGKGTLQAARAYRQYLITHAGVSPDLMTVLVRSLQQESPRRVTVAALARHLNRQLKEAFRTDDFSHPMFHVGPARGGMHQGGGIFWADFDFEHKLQARHPRVWQIFGHTPPQPDGRPFRVSPDQRRVNIDVGICEHYGGHLAYVKLLPDAITGIHCNDGFHEDELLVRTDAPAVMRSG